jgi:bacterioferritin-associated ferredoxin
MYRWSKLDADWHHIDMNTQPTDTEGPVMCHCSGTRRNYIQRLFEEGMDMQAISRWTGALSGCGGCEWDIRDFLKEVSERSAREAPGSESTTNPSLTLKA